MRERILILSILLSLPIYAYGGITVNCPTDVSSCNNTPGCKSTISGCDKCGKGEYCPGNGDIKTCAQETPNFNWSPEGSTSQNDCYKYIGGATETNHCEKQNGESISTCGLFYPNGTPKCWNAYTGEYDENYHIETNNNNKCFSNIRDCNLFGQNGCDNGQQIGYATWNDDSEWVYTTCKCEQGNISYSNCVATVRYKATGIDPDSANGTITYGNTVSSYECKKCPAGTYLTPSDFTPNPQCTGSGVACSCTDVEQGFYSTECTINGTSSCQQTPCPKPGQTTNGAGAGESEQDCHYSPDTEFCDATGCFRISDAGDDNVWHWTY